MTVPRGPGANPQEGDTALIDSATSSATSFTTIFSRLVSFAASRSIVLQNGHATATVPSPGPF